ncbi:MAG: 3-oxoadipate enol-lactonase, partial [Acidobacteriota bacterium]
VRKGTRGADSLAGPGAGQRYTLPLMPRVTANDTDLYYRLEGADDAPAIVLVHALGLDHGAWDLQMPALLAHFQILRCDVRGHGASASPPGDYPMALLAADVLALADRLQLNRFALCGLSIGGMIAQWLAAHSPERVTALVLANTSPRVADPAAIETRRRLVLSQGMRPIADSAIKRFFSPGFLDRQAPVIATARRTILTTNPIGYAGCCAAVRDMDQTPLLGSIRAPTLVVHGDLDVSMPFDKNADLLRQGIAGAQLARIPAAHLSNVEQPQLFTAAILDFLLPMAGSTAAARR